MDSDIFQYMGYAMLKGKTPYLDIFDHKGPFLWFIQMVGLAITGNHVGIFILQILNIILCFTLLYYSAKKISNKKYGLLSVFCIMIILWFYYETGNFSEEWSLLFIIVPLVVYFLNISNRYIPKLYLFTIGVCVGFIALLRINNAAPMLGVLIYSFVKNIIKKEYRYVLNAVVLIFIGFCIPILFFIIGYYLLYGSEAVDWMYFGTISFNLDYTRPIRINDFHDILSWGKYLCGALMPFVFTLPLIKKRRDYVLPLIIGAALTVISIGAYRFTHYLIIIVPLIFFAILSIEGIKVKKCAIFVILVPFFFNIVTQFNISDYSSKLKESYDNSFAQVVSAIPETERNQIWNASGAHFLTGFINTGTIQCNRLLVPQHFGLSKRFDVETLNKIREVVPKYVIYADYAETMVAKSWVTNGACREEDRQYIMDNYVSISSSECLDGTIVRCYKHK